MLEVIGTIVLVWVGIVVILAVGYVKVLLSSKK